MGCFRYILKGKIPIAEPDNYKWSEWIEKAQKTGLCGVGRTTIFHEKYPKKIHMVSTVFLGVDSNYFNEPPLLFESQEFIKENNKIENGDLDRASTWEEAVERHRSLVLSIASRLEKEHGPNVHISSTIGRGYMKWDGKKLRQK